MSPRRRALVSGFYAGAVTRLAAFGIDWFFMIAIYGILVTVTTAVLRSIFSVEFDLSEGGRWYLVGLVVWAFFYSLVSTVLTGRTPGKALVGLRVVNRDGSPLSPGAAFWRVIFWPLSLAIAGIGFLGILFGKENRALHDVIAKTAVVYDWGDRPAELPAPLTEWVDRHREDLPGAVLQGEPEAAANLHDEESAPASTAADD